MQNHITLKIDKSTDETPTNKETGWELYMKRGNKFYFRSPFSKTVLELDPVPPELENMKYGAKLTAFWR